MNRKDFEIVARAVRELAHGGRTLKEAHGPVAHTMAEHIASADGCSGFDRAKFLKACGVPT